MSLSQALGLDWNDFVTGWCLGVTPPFTANEVDIAFDALRRYLPAEIAELRAVHMRGAAIVAGRVYRGLTLAACEDLPGFERVVQRLRHGEQGAMAELKLAQRLRYAGVHPELEAECGTRLLDVRVAHADGVPIYFEVVRPKLADAMVSAYSTMNAACQQLLDENPGACIEVSFASSAHLALIPTVLNVVRELPISRDVREVAPGVLLRRQNRAGGDQPLGFVAQAGETGPGLYVVRMFLHPEGSTSANMDVAMSDQRAQRIFDDERHHFSKDCRNVLVVNVSQVPDGTRIFRPILESQFKPTVNRRVGAVLLVAEHITTSGRLDEQWTPLINSHAYHAIPAEIMDKIVNATCSWTS